MVSLRSVAVSLALVAQLASAYYYQLEVGGMGPSVVSLCITPVDFQNIAQSQAQRQCAELVLADVAGQRVFIGFPEGGYDYVIPVLVDAASASSDVSMLLTSAPIPQDRQQIPCVKVDQYTDSKSWNSPFAMVSYTCGADFLYGQVGTFPAASPTSTVGVVTTTTAAVVTGAPITPTVTTKTVPVSTATPTTTILPVMPTTTIKPTKPAKPTPTTTTCKGGYVGTKTGKGPNGACCRTSDDCRDTCVKGICGVHP